MNWPFVQTMVECDVVSSTNDVAGEILREGVSELPLAVRARRQTRGRGRGSHEWWSDAGSLTFTLAIDPAAHGLGLAHEPLVALATAVAVIDALAELGFRAPPIGIRWPNDLECAGRKLGGILPEPLLLDDRRLLLIGVGLNVQTKLDEAPPLVRQMATSLEALAVTPIAGDFQARLLAAIFRHLELTIKKLAIGDRELPERFSELDLLRDSLVRVDVGTHVIVGRGRGIDSDGAICVDDGKQTIRLFGGRVLR